MSGVNMCTNTHAFEMTQTHKSVSGKKVYLSLWGFLFTLKNKTFFIVFLLPTPTLSSSSSYFCIAFFFFLQFLLFILSLTETPGLTEMPQLCCECMKTQNKNNLWGKFPLSGKRFAAIFLLRAAEDAAMLLAKFNMTFNMFLGKTLLGEQGIVLKREQSLWAAVSGEQRRTQHGWAKQEHSDSSPSIKVIKGQSGWGYC